MFDQHEPVIGLLMGFLSVFAGLLVRTGKWRSWVRIYHNQYVPSYIRNSFLTLIPIGLTFILLVLGGLLMGFGLEQDHASLMIGGLVLLLVGVLGMMMTLVWLYRPPNWLKPPWLRKEDDTR